MNLKKISYIREPGNFFTHLIPALLAVPALCLLLQKAETRSEDMAAYIYGLGIFVLFSVSAIYHSLPRSPQSIRLWQKLDHCCIYLMIAGSFTPTALLVFEGGAGQIMLGSVWLMAGIGCILKAFNRLKKGKLSTGLYIAMGCMVVPFLREMMLSLPPLALFWLLLGGVFYIGGTYFYAKDKQIHRYVHTHEIWHVFVNMGALSHYIYNYVYVFK